MMAKNNFLVTPEKIQIHKNKRSKFKAKKDLFTFAPVSKTWKKFTQKSSLYNGGIKTRKQKKGTKGKSKKHKKNNKPKKYKSKRRKYK
jgi:hypothetical protein